MKKSVKKKNGFTLAEVLITLAIIGIVAALTIPTLVMNFNEKSWDSANKVFRARFEEAMRLTNVTQGISGYATTKDFVNALSKNFKIGKICNSDELSSCFGEKFTFRDTEYETDELQASSNLGLPDWDSEVIGLMFDSGVSALITYDKNCALSDPYSNNTAELTSCVALLYDVNGNGNPNSYEQDATHLMYCFLTKFHLTLLPVLLNGQMIHLQDSTEKEAGLHIKIALGAIIHTSTAVII